MKKIILASLLSATFAMPAFAASTGGYVTADLQSLSTTNNNGLGDPGMGFRIGGGYRFTPNVSAEVGLAQSGSSSSVGGVSYKVAATQVAVVGTYPINSQFDVLGKLGMSANKLTLSGLTCSNCSKTSMMYGVGAQYNVNQQMGVRLQYENLGKTTDSGTSDVEVSALSVGVVYAF